MAGDEGPRAAKWFSEYLGKPVKLVRWIGDGGLPESASAPARLGRLGVPRGFLALGAAVVGGALKVLGRINLGGVLAAALSGAAAPVRLAGERLGVGVGKVPKRPTDPEFAPKHAAVFSDGFPMLLVSDASLEGLNGWMDEPLPMNRFRPNITVSGCSKPFAEDNWGSVVIGGGGSGERSGKETPRPVACDFVKPCSRCTITTVNQETGVMGRQPLQALLEKHSGETLGMREDWKDRPMFGWNTVPRSGVGAVIRVGDTVTVTSTRTFK